MQQAVQCFIMAPRSLLFLSLLLLPATESSAEAVLGKCCPPGQIFSGRSKVDCVHSTLRTTEFYGVGYGASSAYNGFPLCDDPEDIADVLLADVNEDDFLQMPACLEILYEETLKQSAPVIVFCRSNENTNENETTSLAPLPKMLDVKRCCPKDTIFDRKIQSCVSTEKTDYNSTNFDFPSILPKNLEKVDYLKIKRGPPSCSSAIIDYEVDYEDIIFENNTLKVRLPSDKDKDNEEQIILSDDSSCLELTAETNTNRRIVVRTCRKAELCKDKPCIQKCCGEDEYYFLGLGCVKNVPDDEIDFHKALLNYTAKEYSNSESGYGIIIGDPCTMESYPLYPDEDWFITPEGYIHTPIPNTFKHNEYCMDVLYNGSVFPTELYPFICFGEQIREPEASKTRYKVNSVLEIISCMFLLLTFVVYAFLPVLQNLHGKTLMCHVASLFMAFLCLSSIPWVTPNSGFWDTGVSKWAGLCSIVGYTMLFSFLSAFCWLNIMCFDIWWTFGGLRGGSTRGQSHKKRFLLYCLYAWGLALAIAIAGIASDLMEIGPRYLRLGFGLTSCWFTMAPDYYGELVFFVVPITIQLIANVTFFVITAVHCNKVKNEIKRRSDPTDAKSKRYHADKTKLVMNVKLFVVMGISWITEIISFFMSRYASSIKWQEQFFYISDTFNCLQGLLIFILFVLKPRVYVALKRRLGFKDKKKNSSQVTALQDPYKVKKSASNSTLTSSYAVSTGP